jgi:hypothetical protein
MNIRACLAIILGAVLLAGQGLCGGADKRTLMITVLQTDNAELARELLVNTSVSEVDDPRYHATTRTYSTDNIRPPRDLQQVLVIEGQSAYVSVGYRSPEVRFLWAEDTRRGVLPNVGLVTQESISGFYVQAELHGKEVVLQLDQYNGRLQPEYSGYGLNQSIRTSVNGNLGDWLDVGGSLDLDTGPTVNQTYYLKNNTPGHTRLLVKVELVP